MTNRLLLLVLLSWSIIAGPGLACSICGGGILTRLTFREQLQRSDFVAIGRLSNPQFDPNGGAGRTDFQIETLLKGSPKLPQKGTIAVPRYIPTIGSKPPLYLLCCLADDKNQPEPIFGKTSSKAMTSYLEGLLKLDEKDSLKRLAFAFSMLTSEDDAVAADAFLEFAKAPDAELLKVRQVLKPATLRDLMNNPKTPSERLGVYALLLGLCGTSQDADRMRDELQTKPLAERVRSNLGGYLVGLTLLAPDLGWKQIETVLVTEIDSLDRRLAAISAVRFFQATRAKEARPAILNCYKKLILLPDLADLAIDDLRRWQWWDLSADIFKLYDLPAYQAQIMKRGMIRYGLQCPQAEAKRFLTTARQKDPKLVELVEESLKAFEPLKP